MKPRGKKFYDDLGNQIYTVMKATYTNITGFNKAGSRKRGDFKRKSDLDIRFCMSGDPKRATFYPKLERYLGGKLKTFRGERLTYKIGTEGHVLNVLPSEGGKVTLVLLTEKEFDKK